MPYNDLPKQLESLQNEAKKIFLSKLNSAFDQYNDEEKAFSEAWYHVEKKYEEMSVLELKGVLFDLDNQIKQIQNHAQQQVVPILQKKIQEEKQNSV